MATMNIQRGTLAQMCDASGAIDVKQVRCTPILHHGPYEVKKIIMFRGGMNYVMDIGNRTYLVPSYQTYK
jgi:hypothetical protein